MRNQFTPADAEAFWQRVNREGPISPYCPDLGPCWPCSGRIVERGYVQVYIPKSTYTAHRVAYILTYGLPPADRPIVSHLCNNPPCCNPAHLKADTQRGNLQYMDECGRCPMGDQHYSRQEPERLSRGNAHYTRHRPEAVMRGERNGKAKLTPERVREIRAMHASGLSQVEIERRTGVDQTNVSLIVRRKAWRHIE